VNNVVFRRGDRGPAVAEVRARLARLGLLPGSSHVRTGDPLMPLLKDPDDSTPAQVDPAEWETTALVSAEYDEAVEAAVKAFQERFGITVDGIVGPETFTRLEEARWRLGDRVLSYHPGRPVSGEDVAELQRRMDRMGFDIGREDGLFGPLTDTSVREFQLNVGVPVDGAAGPVTLRALARLHRTVGKESSHAARERYALDQLRTGVAGKRVAIDPGHGYGDSGDTAHGVSESDVTCSLAVRIEGRLAALGTRIVLTRPIASHSTPAEAVNGESATGPGADRQRAQFCNDADADLVLSLHCTHSSPTDSPMGAYYYGRADGTFSQAGEVAAASVCEQIEASTATGQCINAPRTWDILRMTRMPAVRIELGLLEDPATSNRLRDPAYLDALAGAIALGVESFFSPAPVATG